MERLTRAHYKASDGYYLVCSEMCEREDCTEECGHFDEAIERLAAYEDTGLTPEEVLPKDKADEIALKLMRLADLESFCSYTRLRELAEADKDGRLAVLPCKIGGTVYLLLQDDVKHNPETCGWYISEDRVGAIAEGGFYLGDPADDVYVRNEEIGEEVFLTREGAERALEGRK